MMSGDQAKSSSASSPEDRKPKLFSKEDCEDLEWELNDIVNINPENRNAVGLAIVFGISNAIGTRKDVQNMSKTFKQLNFAVWEKQSGATNNAVCKIIQTATQHFKEYPLRYKVFIVYFAGHGGSHDSHSFIKTVDEKKLFIKEGIVDFFLPENSPSLGAERANKDRYRLFFFDCCLTDFSRADVVNKRPSGNLPAGANTLVAYATSLDYKCQGFDDGGVWTKALSENLQLDLPITTILDITCDQVIDHVIVNKENQSPHYVSSVGILCLKSQIFTWKEYCKRKGNLTGIQTFDPTEISTKNEPIQDHPINVQQVNPASQQNARQSFDTALVTAADGVDNETFSPSNPQHYASVLLEVKDVTGCWDMLGLILGVNNADIERIKSNNRGDALSQEQAIIKAWINKDCASWAILVSALKHELVGKIACANEIARRHPATMITQ